MEFRYVYRRIEDAIGTQLRVPDNPHSKISLRVRDDLLELRDVMSVRSAEAICLSAITGSGRVDVGRMSDSIEETLSSMRKSAFPYVRQDERRSDDGQDLYSQCFAMLAEMDRDMAVASNPDG